MLCPQGKQPRQGGQRGKNRTFAATQLLPICFIHPARPCFNSICLPVPMGWLNLRCLSNNVGTSASEKQQLAVYPHTQEPQQSR
jgi:hypothetical protein